MPDAELCSEVEIQQLVQGFYASVRRDEVLGPIFDGHVADWDEHLVKLTDFWSSALRGTRRYRGTPMPTHAALPGLSAELFERWLRLFNENAAKLPNERLRERATALAQRIAQSLWYGYQMHRDPDRVAEDLSHG
jgi:hemoglobin